MARLAIHKLLLSDDAVVGLEFLATTLADKHLATVLPNYVLFRHWQRLESLVTDITGVNTFSLLCLAPPPHTDPIEQHHEIPHKLTLNTCGSRCQQMSTLLHVHLKVDPSLKGDVEDGEADPSACHQRGQVSVL